MQNERENKIIEKLKEYETDIISLQESFSHKTTQNIINSLQKIYPYSETLQKKEKFYQLLSSGLLILSKYPIKKLDEVVFNECKGADCFAAKGFLLVEIEVLGRKKLQLGITHLQAHDNKKYENIRDTQITQIKQSLEKHYNSKIAQILVGDFNIVYKSTEYQKLLKYLDLKPINLDSEILVTTAPNNPCYSTPEKGSVAKWIDYIFVRNLFLKIQTQNIHVLPSRNKINDMECELSDHLPIIGTFIYE